MTRRRWKDEREYGSAADDRRILRGLALGEAYMSGLIDGALLRSSQPPQPDVASLVSVPPHTPTPQPLPTPAELEPTSTAKKA